ncbi:MAG TPA: hypothetical protein VF414_06545, partial [Thermoanaerobaculia bacterium]
PALRSLAVVAVPYGQGGLAGQLDADADEYGAGPGGEPLGVVGVIGPSRMDYARVIPLVRYCSRLLTHKLRA